FATSFLCVHRATRPAAIITTAIAAVWPFITAIIIIVATTNTDAIVPTIIDHTIIITRATTVPTTTILVPATTILVPATTTVPTATGTTTAAKIPFMVSIITGFLMPGYLPTYNRWFGITRFPTLQKEWLSPD